MDKEEFCSAYITWFPENEGKYREHKHEDFRTYINTVLIRQNVMMSDVPPLC